MTKYYAIQSPRSLNWHSRVDVWFVSFALSKLQNLQAVRAILESDYPLNVSLAIEILQAGGYLIRDTEETINA